MKVAEKAGKMVSPLVDNLAACSAAWKVARKAQQSADLTVARKVVTKAARSAEMKVVH